MSASNDGGPAFPVPSCQDANGQICWGQDGMSLRDWFAGQATEQDVQHHGGGWCEAERRTWTSEEAKYRYADAMLAAKEARK